LQSLHISFDQLLKDGSHEWFVRYSRVLEEQEGYLPISDSALAESPNSRYAGSPDKIYTRYRYRFGKYISMGITGEKDAGEQFFRGYQKQGFDFYSAHLFVRDIGFVRAAVIGDYQLSFGQGLTFATGLAMGKNSNTIAIKRPGSSIRPFTSANENEFLRGAAFVTGFRNFEVTGFYSSLNIDANRIISEDTSEVADDGIAVSSLLTTGLHSTPAEIEDRDAMRMTHFGGHLAYKTRKMNIGLTAVHSILSGNLDRNLSLYNQFEFTGDKITVYGTDFSYVWRNIHLFGEASMSSTGGAAAQAGMIIAPDPRMSLSVLYRNYGKKYQSLYANAFAENTNPWNEKGLYIGIESRISGGWTLNAYFDRFESSWLRYQVNAPSTGVDYLAQLTWKPSKRMDMYWRFRQRNKVRNNDLEDGIEFPVNSLQTNIRYQLAFKVEESLTFKTRVEGVKLEHETDVTEHGYVIYQDVIYKPMKSPFSITLRYAIFDTDSYDSRIYVYENDVLYYFAIPSYYDRGSRFYAILRYKVGRACDIWVKYGQFLYNNRTTIGSGLDEIQGNRKSEVRIQLRLSF
jgi:hypothetical protein